MQQQPTPAGPLTTPKAFRRSTGAHALLVSLVLADLANFLLVLAIGALLGALLEPPTRWCLQECIILLHASLLLDIGVGLILCCIVNGLLRQHVLKKAAEDAWGCAGELIIVLVTALIVLPIVEISWMTIPSPVIPPIQRSPLSWSPSPSFLGSEVAAGLYVLAHTMLWRRDRRETAEKLRTFSRAHQDGPLWTLLEEVYDFYRRGLARFEHPPVKQLKTPPMFYFYPRTPPPGEGEVDALTYPERDLYLVARELVMCQAHLGPKPEQTEILLPLVARLLHDYNSPIARVEHFLRLAELAKSSVFCFWLLPIPVIVAQSCKRHWQEMERERVLDRDRFASECGESGRLRKLLHRQLSSLHRTNQPDNTVPTLAERIDHLDSLRRNEGRQVKKLRATLPPAPPAPPTAS